MSALFRRGRVDDRRRSSRGTLRRDFWITTLAVAAVIAAHTSASSAALLSVKTTGPGSVSVMPLGTTLGCTSAGWCRYSYPDTATVSVFAAPAAPPATFVGWRSDCRPARRSLVCRLSMDVHRNAFATFGPVTLQIQDSVGGTTHVDPAPQTTCGPGCFTFPYSSAVTVVAQPDQGWQPYQWTGACVGTPATVACPLTLFDRVTVGPLFCQPEDDTCAVGMQQPYSRYPTIHVGAVGRNAAVTVLRKVCRGPRCNLRVKVPDVVVQAVGWRPGFYWTGQCHHRRPACQLDTGKDLFGNDAEVVGHFPS
jgi:hypothetical protein